MTGTLTPVWRGRAVPSLLLLAGLLMPAAPARGEVRRASNPFFPITAPGILRNPASLPPGLPARLETRREVYLVVESDGAYLEAQILGHRRAEPARLARMLERAVSGTALEGRPVEWEETAEFAAARVTLSRGRWGAREVETTVPLGRLAAGLREAGLRPHVLLGVPRHAEASVPPFPCVDIGNRRWYHASAAGDLEVTVRTRATDRGAAVAALFLRELPFLSLAGILAALGVARYSRLPFGWRRRLHTALSLGVPLAASAGYLAAGWRFMSSGGEPDPWRRWFGIPAQDALFWGPHIPAGMVCLALVAWGATAPRDPALTPEEQAALRREVRWRVPFIALGLALVIAQLLAPFGNRGLQLALSVAGVLLSMGAPSLVQWLLRRRGAAPDPRVPSSELTRRAWSLAARLGVEIREVRVDRGPEGRLGATVALRPGRRIVVSEEAAEFLPPEQLDFLLARELAELAGRHRTRLYLLAGLGGLLIAPVVGFADLRAVLFPELFDPTFGDQTRLSLCLGGLILLLGLWCAGVFRLHRRMEQRLDRTALEITRDRAAAEAALEAMNRMNWPGDRGPGALSPRLARQIAALRRAAAELGI